MINHPEVRSSAWTFAALVVAVATAIVGGLLAALPAFLTVIGLFQLAALSTGRGDPTWNDGDGWYTLAGAVAFVVLIVVFAIVGWSISRTGLAPRRSATLVCVGGALLVAAIPTTILVSQLHF